MPPWSLSVAEPSSGRSGGRRWRAGWVEPAGEAFLPGQICVMVLLGAPAEGADGLGADPERWRGEVGQRDLFQLDDLHRAGVGARRDRTLACLVARLIEDRPPSGFPDVEDPVHLAADRGNGSSHGVGRIEVVGPDDLAD